jgi:membrane peptidoglycan carboxypeptidase
MLRMSSHGDDIEVTTVQLAALASVFATGGTLVTPHLPRTPEEGRKFKTEVRRQLNIPQENLRRMLVGMVGAVNYGSGRKAYNPEQTIAGKTGTCIGSGGVWVGLFTSFAPVEDPQLAVAVIGRGTDARKHFPVAVANQIYRTLSYRFGSRNGRAPYQFTPPTVVPKLPVDAIADEEADEVDTEAKEAMTGATNVMTPAEETNGGVKPVLMPAAQQPRPTPAPALRSAQPAPQQQSRPSAGDERPRRVNTERPPQ